MHDIDVVRVVHLIIATTLIVVPTFPFAEAQHQCTSLTWHKNTTADFIIAGIFPVHYYAASQSKFVFNPAGLTWVEAMLYTIEQINKDRKLLPNVTLGFAVYDSCNNADLGLQATLDIIQEPKVIPSASRIQLSYNKPMEAVKCFCNKTKPPIVAVVGDAASSSSITIASVLGANGVKMPQISYSSTSTALSNKNYYPSFLRTIPPDEYQAMFIVDILKKFNWTYVSFIASDDAYGRLGVENLLPRLESQGICVAVSEVFETTKAGKRKVTEIVSKLVADKKSTVIVLWCQYPEADVVLKEAEKQKLYDRIWVATETWGSNKLVFNVNKRVVSGLLGIIPTTVVYSKFEDFLKSLSPNKTAYNPWLDSFWRNNFGCNSADNITYYCKNTTTATGLPRNKFANVMDAVYSVAHGLHNAFDTFGKKIQPDTLLDFIKKVNFVGKTSLTVSFNENGDPGVASYSLTNLQSDGNGTTKFTIIGGWNSRSRLLSLLPGTRPVFSNWSTAQPNSSCSEQCQAGYFAFTFPSKPCCWRCVPCANKMVQPKAGMKECILCKGEKVANGERTQCVVPMYKHIALNNFWGISIFVCSLVVLLIEVSILGVILHRWNTPLVKAMNRELTLLQLASMTVIFLMPLLYIWRPTSAICSLRAFYFVICYTVSVSVTFTKTDRLLRIFKASTAGRLKKTSRVLNNKIQFLTVFALTVIACLLCTIFHFVFQPKLIEKVGQSPDGTEMTFSCGSDFDVLFLILLSYIIGISLTCSIFAFRARKLPENYNEARYTSFAMFSFCLAWLFFLPLYFSMSTPITKEFMILIISLISTSARLFILYGPKMFVIVFRPEENTVERFRAKLKAQQSHKRSTSGASPSQHARNQHEHGATLKTPMSSPKAFDTSRTRNLAFEISVDNG